MWRGSGVGGCIDFFNTQPVGVGVGVSVKHNPLHWVSPLSTKRNTFSVSVSPTPLSNSNNPVIKLKQPPQLSFLSSSPPAPPFLNRNNPPPQLPLLSLLFFLSTVLSYQFKSPLFLALFTFSISCLLFQPSPGYWSNFLLGYYFNPYHDGKFCLFD